MKINSDPDRLANFVHNERQRLNWSRENNSLNRAGLKDEEEHWSNLHNQLVEKGDLRKADVVQRRLESIRSEQQHEEQQSTYLAVLSEVIDEAGMLPEVRDRLQRITETQRAIDSERRSLR